jgi:integrase
VQDVWATLLSKQHPKARRLLARRTVELALVTLRLVLAEAVARGLIAANPVDAWRAVQPRGRATGRLAKVSPAKVLTSDEREALLSSVARRSPHAYPFVLFLAECGVRIGEAVALEWATLISSGGYLHREKTQTRRSSVSGAWCGRSATCAQRDDLRCARNRDSSRRARVHGTEGGPIQENFRRRVWAPP